MKLEHLSAVALALVLTACATQRPPANVVPLAGGQYRTIGIGAAQDEAQKAALDAADEACSKRKMRHVVLSESATYKGVVSEETNRNMQAASAVLSWTKYRRTIPTLAGDDDYQVTLTFTCES